MKTFRKGTALLIALVMLAALVPARAGWEEWIYEKADLPMLYDLLWDCVSLSGDSEIAFCFPKTLTDELSADALVNMVFRAAYMVCPEGYSSKQRVMSDGSLRVELTGLRLRSGEKMLEAYNTGDRSRLTGDEKKCLDRIANVMNGLMKQYPEGSLELETAIYDYICEHVRYQTYPSGDGRREACTSACNAFMNGWGNCQAYADLFRLMANMGGFSVGLVSGTADGEGHMWNWIEILDDEGYRDYMVDVTFGDYDDYQTAVHSYMNFGLDRADDRVWYRELYTLEIERSTDDAYTYYGGGAGRTARTLAEASEYCAGKIKNGGRYAEVLIFRGGLQKGEIQSALEKAMGRTSYKWQYCFDAHGSFTVLCLRRK